MKLKLTILVIFAVLSACTPARMATEAAVKTGRVALGAVDLVL